MRVSSYGYVWDVPVRYSHELIDLLVRGWVTTDLFRFRAFVVRRRLDNKFEIRGIPMSDGDDECAAWYRAKAGETMTPSREERRDYATLHTQGWAGRQQQPCLVVGETPKRYRVRALPGCELRFPRRGNGVLKVLSSGTYLVPKTSITFTEPRA